MSVVEPFEWAPGEAEAIHLLQEAAAAFTAFCDVVHLVEGWNYDSVYNLLITYDGLRDDHRTTNSPEVVLAMLARRGLVAGPYDEDGYMHQGVSDELSEALETLYAPPKPKPAEHLASSITVREMKDLESL